MGAERMSGWLKRNPAAGAKDVQNKLEENFHVKVKYHKAWSGRAAALTHIHGSWDESFQLLFNFKAELELKSPGSIVEIDLEPDGDLVRFSKIFVALKPCIDGFLNGCRPYLGVDSTHLTGTAKTQGQDSDNHYNEINKEPKVIEFLKKEHKGIWRRSQFSLMSKVDYVNNNLSESFNSWIKHIKGLHVVDLLDHIRQMLMHKFDLRRTIGSKLDCLILPNITKSLNLASRSFTNIKMHKGGNYGEISGNDLKGNPWRHVVDLDVQQCSCREWQLTGIPCVHVIAFISYIRGPCWEDLVHEYYSVDKFRAAYEGRIPALTNKSKWVKIDLGYKVHPPLHKRSAGRPRKKRIPSCLEPAKKRQQCKKCKQFGHQQRTCKNDEELVAKRKRKRCDSNAATEDLLVL